MRMILLAVFAALAGAPALAQEPISTHEVVEAAITQYIRPEFHKFAELAAAMQGDVEALCATPSQAGVDTARSAFRDVVLSYSRIEFVQVGPLVMDNHLERLLFWPDRKGIALKQVQQALAAKDETAAKPETLLQKSVAMQGLAALEYLLFGTGAETLATADGAYRCSYARSITTLMADLAAELDRDWSDPDGISAAMLNPRPDASDFRTDLEVLEKLAATLIHGTEALRDQRLKPIEGTAEGAPKPRSALFWRSDMTIPAVRANFAGLADFFEKARFPEAISAGEAETIAGIRAAYAKAQEVAALITSPIEAAVSDPVQFKALDDLVVITRDLDQLEGQNLARDLNLSVGFSALDSD